MTTLESDPVAMDESTDDNDSIVESEEHSSQTETEDDSDDSSEEEEESKSIVTTIPKRISMQPSTIVTEQDKIEFLKRLEVTEEQIEHIRCIDQRTPEWKEARKDRLTGSNFGAAANLSPYQTPLQLVANMLWAEFQGNVNTQYGTTVEPWVFKIVEMHMRQKYEKLGYQKVWMEETGLLISKEYPWLGVSSDGLLHLEKDGIEEIVTIEIKGPPKGKFYPGIPRYYFSQIQGAMALLKVKRSYFVVYTPEATQISEFPFNQEYWDTNLLPAMKKFYMDEYVPRRILQQRGLLKQGKIDVQPVFKSNVDLSFMFNKNK